MSTLYIVVGVIAVVILLVIALMIWTDLSNEKNNADKAKHQTQLEKDDEEDIYLGL